MKLLETLVRFTDWLLRSSWQASVLIVLVLLVQWVFRKQLAPRWRYAFWLLVLIRLALPLAPESSVSVFNLAPKAWAKTFSQDHRASEVQPVISTAPVSESSLPLSNENAETNASVLASSSSTNDKVGRAALSLPPDGELRTSRPTDTAGASASLILSILWLFGALLFAAFTFWFPLRLNRQLANQHSLVNPAVREVLADCQRVMRVRRVLPVVQSQAVRGPALMGFIRPWLLLPEGMLEKFTPEELRFVFLHELAHLKRRDIAVNWLMTFLLILHWFNPLVWFAFARMRADRELACDALALSYANEREAKPYGQTILKLLDGFTRPAVVAGLVGILENQQQMKRRIAMIAQFKPSTGWPVLALALVSLLGCVSLTDAKKNGAGNAAAEGSAVISAPAVPDRQLIIQKIVPDKLDHWDHWVAFGDTRPSPDGRYFGYVNWSHGNLAICDTHTGEARDLTTEGTWAGPDQFTWGAVWSPDSKQIAFIWIKGHEGDLRIVDRAGGPPRILVPRENGGSIAPFDWSKDGRYVVGLAPIKKWSEGEKKTMKIVRVDVTTGAVKVVKELPVATDNAKIALSPDGKYIAHDTQPRGKDVAISPLSRIYIVSSDGSTNRLLIDHPASYSSPHWTPDGRHLIFRSNRSGEDALWSVAVRDGAAVAEPKLRHNGFENAKLWGFADDGTLYYSASTPRINVFVAEVNFEAGTMQPAKLVSLRNDGKNYRPCWSIDGSQLAYVSIRSGGWPPAGAFVFQEFATGKEHDVEVAALNFFSQPFWSPDLSKLIGPAKVPGRDNNSRALYLVDAKSGQRSIFLDKDAADGNYTADGKYLIYRNHIWEGPEAGGELIERDLRSGAERVILHRKDSGFGEPVLLSPDGTKLAYCERPYSTTTKEKTALLLTARADGKTEAVWELASGEADMRAWLPDSRRVLISVKDNQGSQQLHLIDTETKNDRPFGPSLRGEDQIGQISVHPARNRIAFSRGGRLQEVWTMKNLVPQEKLAAK